MEAVDDGLTDIVECLLESGADPNLANEVIIALFATAIYLIHT